MKMTNKLLAATLAAALCMPVAADDEETADDYMLSVMELEIKHGHGTQFREAMTAYMMCYAKNEGTNEWSTWGAVDGEPNRMSIVSRMDMWAEMDSEDPGYNVCWPEHGEDVTSHVSSAERRFWKNMPEWSGYAEDFTVVKVHNFRVEDGAAFRETVGDIVGLMKEAEYEHMGTWYAADGSKRGGADYFVVDYYENFAAMDEERSGANDIMVDALGEAGAREMWERFGDTLAETDPYWTVTLRRIDSLSHSSED